jgi:hypothetical protein
MPATGRIRPRKQPHSAAHVSNATWIRTGGYIHGEDEHDGFCLAVLANDLEGALARADAANLRALPAIVHWLSHHAPRGSWGSMAALGDWPRIARVHAGSKV